MRRLAKQIDKREGCRKMLFVPVCIITFSLYYTSRVSICTLPIVPTIHIRVQVYGRVWICGLFVCGHGQQQSDPEMPHKYTY